MKGRKKMWLFVAFLAVPLIEIALFIQIGGMLGIGTTLLIVAVTAVLGTYLVRTQGLMELGKLQSSFSQLQDPTEPLAHGAMILFAGALLLTPGFFTDGIGFALCLPFIRTRVFHFIRKRMTVRSFHMEQEFTPRKPHTAKNDFIIEGEFEEIDKNNSKPSNWSKH